LIDFFRIETSSLRTQREKAVPGELGPLFFCVEGRGRVGVALFFEGKALLSRNYHDAHSEIDEISH
jgi:hypothetical protein